MSIGTGAAGKQPSSAAAEQQNPSDRFYKELESTLKLLSAPWPFDPQPLKTSAKYMSLPQKYRYWAETLPARACSE